MLTRAEAIKHLEPYLDNECYTEKHRQAVKLAIDALREQEDRANPQPLTLEELDRMEGEPVWVEHYSNGGEWVTVHWDIHNSITTAYKACLRKSDYGEYWIAYRHKQEEAQDNE